MSSVLPKVRPNTVINTLKYVWAHVGPAQNVSSILAGIKEPRENVSIILRYFEKMKMFQLYAVILTSVFKIFISIFYHEFKWIHYK